MSNFNLSTKPYAEYRNDRCDDGCEFGVKGVIVLHGRKVIFGEWDGDDFFPSAIKSSRTYATPNGARRAIAKWLAN